MARDLIGETLLGQFRVQTFVAAGGMATIYRVWDLQRSVPLAMKVLRPELADDPAFLNRFEREASSLQALNHPHIVPFYGLFHDEDLTFLLERFIDGPTLEEILRKRAGKPLPAGEALVVFKALYTSIGYAHAKGIVHCDVKPGNVLIDRGGAVYLTDFGIARYFNAALTSTSVMGTPLYMSPEQFTGSVVTPATDVYLLGLLLYELFTGKRPFTGGDGLPPEAGKDVIERVRWQHMRQPPPDLRAASPHLPAALSVVVQRAMAKQPSARYASVQELAAAVGEALGVQIDALPDRLRLPELAEGAAAPQIEPPKARQGLGGLVERLRPRPKPQPEPPVPQQAAEPQPQPFDPPEESDTQEVRRPAPQPAAQAPDPIYDTLPAAPKQAEPLPIPPGYAPAAPPAAPAPIRWRTWVPLIALLIVLGLCGAAALAAARGWGTTASQLTPLPNPTDPALPGVLVSATPAENQPTPAEGTPADQPTATLAPDATEPVAAGPLPQGQLVIVRREKGHERLFLLDLASGAQEELPEVLNAPQNLALAPVFSPDGQRLAFQARYNGRMHIAVMDMTEREAYQIAAAERYDNVAAPAWLAGGQALSFYATASGAPLLVVADAASGEEQTVYNLPQYRNLFAWSPAGDRVAFAYQDGSLQVRIATSPTSAEWSIDSGGEEYAPAWSADGAWIAFQGDGGREPGRNEIWIAAADGTGPRPVTSTPPENWSRAPTWSPDGRYIAYVSDRSGSIGNDFGELFIVEVASGQTWQATSSGGSVYDWRPAWRP